MKIQSVMSDMPGFAVDPYKVLSVQCLESCCVPTGRVGGGRAVILSVHGEVKCLERCNSICFIR